MLEASIAALPEGLPRMASGAGSSPEAVLQAVSRGVDVVDGGLPIEATLRGHALCLGCGRLEQTPPQQCLSGNEKLPQQLPLAMPAVSPVENSDADKRPHQAPQQASSAMPPSSQPQGSESEEMPPESLEQPSLATPEGSRLRNSEPATKSAAESQQADTVTYESLEQHGLLSTPSTGLASEPSLPVTGNDPHLIHAHQGVGSGSEWKPDAALLADLRIDSEPLQNPVINAVNGSRPRSQPAAVRGTGAMRGNLDPGHHCFTDGELGPPYADGSSVARRKDAWDGVHAADAHTADTSNPYPAHDHFADGQPDAQAADDSPLNRSTSTDAICAGICNPEVALLPCCSQSPRQWQPGFSASRRLGLEHNARR